MTPLVGKPAVEATLMMPVPTGRVALFDAAATVVPFPVNDDRTRRPAPVPMVVDVFKSVTLLKHAVPPDVAAETSMSSWITCGPAPLNTTVLSVAPAPLSKNGLAPPVASAEITQLPEQLIVDAAAPGLASIVPPLRVTVDAVSV